MRGLLNPIAASRAAPIETPHCHVDVVFLGTYRCRTATLSANDELHDVTNATIGGHKGPYACLPPPPPKTTVGDAATKDGAPARKRSKAT